VKRQSLNVFRMQMLGAEVVSVTSGSRTLKDATNEALRYWVAHVRDTFYVIGSVVGPHPYPAMVRDFQRVIGDETRKQILAIEGRLPDSLVACVGGGSNSMGMFYPFLQDSQVKMYGVEAAGKGLDTQEHAATLTLGSKGVLHGALSYLLQEYAAVTDQEALDAFYLLARTEGIIPALESAHALAQVVKLAPQLPKDHIMVLCLSGRGDKDVEQVATYQGGR